MLLLGIPIFTFADMLDLDTGFGDKCSDEGRGFAERGYLMLLLFVKLGS